MNFFTRQPCLRLPDSVPANFTAAFLLTCGALLTSTDALGSNGLYLPGYGMESVMMGGADVAVARDAFAANNNPAGMTQTTGRAADIEVAFWDWREASHTDDLNYRKPSPRTSFGAYGNAAYVQRDANSPFAIGGSLIVQGGVGWSFSGLNLSPALGGGRDDASSLFTIVKLGPAMAWQVNDRISVGAALGINYVAGTQELFPNTPNFPGFRFKDASGVEWSYKLGLQYRPTQDVTIGMTYSPQTSIPMKNGTLRINVPGLGVVRYDNAKLDGIRLPEELALGLSFRPAPRLLASLQWKWYNWSEALNTLHLTASNPRTIGAPPSQGISSSVDMLNQNVYSLGIAYDYDESTVIMAGINHGKRPIDEQHITPIFQPIPVRHYMLGVSRRLDAGWQAAGGIELMPLQSVTYSNPLFGTNVNERHYGYMLHLGLGRRW